MESFRIHLLFKSASFTAILTSSLPYFNLHEHATGIKKSQNKWTQVSEFINLSRQFIHGYFDCQVVDFKFPEHARGIRRSK